MPSSNKQKIAEYQKLYRQKNLDMIKAKAKAYRNKNRDKLRIKSQEIRLALKLQAIDAYGPRICSWCGEDDITVLTIDHVDNDGNCHFDDAGYRIRGSRIYTWLKINGYPKNYQILCANCNYAKSRSTNNTLPENRKNLRKSTYV